MTERSDAPLAEGWIRLYMQHGDYPVGMTAYEARQAIGTLALKGLAALEAATPNRGAVWDYVEPAIAKRIGLTGFGGVRFHNDCIYMKNDDGEWYELQVPALPSSPQR